MLFGGFTESQSKDFEEEIDEEEVAEDYGYLSDSDLEDDEDEDTNQEVHPFGSVEAPGEDKPFCEDEDHGKCVGKGKVVKIPDVAFVT